MTNLHELIERSRAIIAKEGHLIVATGDQARLSYTVGLTTHLGYEVYVVGLPPAAAQPILNALAVQLKQSEHPDDTDLDGLANAPLRLRFLSATDSAAVARRFRMLSALGFAPARIRQLVLPDVAGRFPGQPGYDTRLDQTLEAAGI